MNKSTGSFADTVHPKYHYGFFIQTTTRFMRQFVSKSEFVLNLICIRTTNSENYKEYVTYVAVVTFEYTNY